MTPQEKNSLIEGLIEKHSPKGLPMSIYNPKELTRAAMSELIDLLEPRYQSVEEAYLKGMEECYTQFEAQLIIKPPKQ